MKKRITSILNNKFSEKFIIVLIVFNILVFCCGLDNFINSFYIQIFDLFSMVIFTGEYIMRLVILQKAKDIFKPLLMMDLIAILPYYLAFLPFKTTFLRLISGYGDFYPAATLGRIIDPLIIIITAGIHGLIIDIVVPACLKFMRRKQLCPSEVKNERFA